MCKEGSGYIILDTYNQDWRICKTKTGIETCAKSWVDGGLDPDDIQIYKVQRLGVKSSFYFTVLE
jgi:hypothetical protein